MYKLEHHIILLPRSLMLAVVVAGLTFPLQTPQQPRLEHQCKSFFPYIFPTFSTKSDGITIISTMTRTCPADMDLPTFCSSGLHPLSLQDSKVRSWLGQPDTFPCSSGFVPWHLISGQAQSSAKVCLGPGPCPPPVQSPALVISTIMMVTENKTPGRESQSRWFPQLPLRSASMTERAVCSLQGEGPTGVMLYRCFTGISYYYRAIHYIIHHRI